MYTSEYIAVFAVPRNESNSSGTANRRLQQVPALLRAVPGAEAGVRCSNLRGIFMSLRDIISCSLDLAYHCERLGKYFPSPGNIHVV